MVQPEKTKLVDLQAKLAQHPKSNQWVSWVIGGLIAVALIVPLVLAVPSFLPKRQPSYGNVPSGAESLDATSGAGALPPVAMGDRAAMIEGAKSGGVQIMDDSTVSVHYDKDTQHAILSVPTGSGKTFQVKTYRLARQGDSSWSPP